MEYDIIVIFGVSVILWAVWGSIVLFCVKKKKISPEEDDNLQEVVVERPADEQQDELQEVICHPPIVSVPRKSVTIDDFQFHRIIGEGGYGKVLLAELKNKSEFFAVKALKKKITEKEPNMVERRVLALAWEHPFLTHLYCSFQTKGHLFYVMELLNGDLRSYLREQSPFDLNRATFYGAEIVCAIQFLHSKGIIHRDLKLENVMLDRDGHIKITDFGMCVENIFGDNKICTFCGTPSYYAPEVIKSLKYSYSVDWWCLGVMLYRMLISKMPFLKTYAYDQKTAILINHPEYPSSITEESRDILQKLLSTDPNIRLGVTGDIRLHPFFSTIDWKALEKREVEPPYKPLVKPPSYYKIIDNEAPQVSLSNESSEDQNTFSGFSFIHPRMEDLLKAEDTDVRGIIIPDK